MRARLLVDLSLSAILAIAMLAFVTAPPAAAVPTDTLGWCTTVGHGQQECGFGSALQACVRQHEVFAPSTPFYGAAPFGTVWYNNTCRWQTGAGIVSPTIVQFKCANGLIKPTAPWGCQPPPLDDCQNKGATPLGATPHPIDLVSGAKTFHDVDYQTADGALLLARSYTTLLAAGSPSKLAAVPLGLANWRFDFQVELQIADDWETLKVVTVVLPSGRGFSFQRQTDGSITTYRSTTYPRRQTDYTLTFDGTWPTDLNTIRNAKTYWTLRGPDDSVWSLETFADVETGLFTIARPVSVTRRTGLQLTLQYGTSSELTSIADSYGKRITFGWNFIDPSIVGGTGAALPGAITQANLPGGYKLRYSYGTIGMNPTGLPQPDRLEKVEFLDMSDGVLDSTTYRYDDANVPHAITSILDKDNVLRWNVTYDEDGHATVSEGPGGADSVTVAYGANDTTFTRTVTNALGKRAIYNYTYTNTPLSYNVTLTSIAGQASAHCPASTGSFAYTGDLLSSQTDEEGRVTTYTRDEKARVTQRVEASGTALARPTNYTWHPTFNLLTQIVRPGLTTDITYDPQGRPTSKTETDTTTHTVPYSTNGQTRRWNYTWNEFGQLLTVDGPLPGSTDQTAYRYDALGYLATLTNGRGHIITVNTVNSRGQPTQVTDANGVVIDFARDGLGRLTSATVDPGAKQAVMSFQYNVIGQMTQVTLPNNVRLTYTYNAAKRLTSITNDANEQLAYTHNNAGSITGVDTKNADGTIVVQVGRTYDELSRLLKTIGAANQETQFEYDMAGNNTRITDPRSQVYRNMFDDLNRLTRVTDPNLFETNITFTGRDDLASVTDARTNATAYVRNGWGDIIRETSPDRGVTDYVYDARGLMTQRTDARGQVMHFTYDDLERMTARSFPNAPSETITWSYDATEGGNKGVGRLTGSTDASGTYAYTYNELGHMTHVVRVIGAHTYHTYYAYNNGGDVTEITLPSGRLITTMRDSLARVTSVATKDDAGASSNTVVSSVVWRPFGPLASLTFGNAIDLTLTYDADGRVTDIDADGGTTVQDLNYGYNVASDITAIGDNLTPSRNQTFVYDRLNRLTSATGPFGTNTYDYDAVGNRTQRTVTVPFPGTETYTTPSTSNRLASISGAVNRSFTYAASGQAVTDQRSPVDSWTYTIDKAGRMSAAILNGVPQAIFAYDANERRIVNTNALTGAVTDYIHDADGQLLAEMDGTTGNPIREYIWLGALPIGYVDRLGASGASRLFFIHADHLARPQKITDSSRTIVWDGVFAPFGERHSITGSIDNVLMFPGQIYDPATGLTQNGHRDYEPNLGRYLESDPIGIASTINTYAYAGGNPVSRIDPTGMSPGEPYGTLNLGFSMSALDVLELDFGQLFNTHIKSGAVGIYHDVTCATCFWDWTQNWGVYKTEGVQLSFSLGSAAVDFGYSRGQSFFGKSQGAGFEIPIGTFCPSPTGWQLSVGPTLGLGNMFYKSETRSVGPARSLWYPW